MVNTADANGLRTEESTSLLGTKKYDCGWGARTDGEGEGV